MQHFASGECSRNQPQGGLIWVAPGSRRALWGDRTWGIECQPGSRAGDVLASGAWMHSPAIRKVRVKESIQQSGDCNVGVQVCPPRRIRDLNQSEPGANPIFKIYNLKHVILKISQCNPLTISNPIIFFTYPFILWLKKFPLLISIHQSFDFLILNPINSSRGQNDFLGDQFLFFMKDAV
ncbi:hypothetical protein EF405_19955 [Cyclobacteriaceae bacterium YHN15]|nr:hypothetical protein EF405_19955 [Cyclobacteriaceae bacterium YHN15]